MPIAVAGFHRVRFPGAQWLHVVDCRANGVYSGAVLGCPFYSHIATETLLKFCIRLIDLNRVAFLYFKGFD